MSLHRLLAFSFLLATGPALAQQPAPSVAALAQRAAQRYPQPIRVGELIHRQVLRPVEQQDVLGRVASVMRRPDGAILVIVDLGGVLGLGTRPVAVPIEAVALLGEYVTVLDLTPEQLRTLPTFDGASAVPLEPAAVIRVGLTRPFH